MADPAQEKLNKQLASLDKNLKEVYKQAEVEINEKLKEFQANYKVKKSILVEKYNNKEINSMQLHNWYEGQKFMLNQLKEKKQGIISVLTNSNEIAMQMINGESMDAFVFGSNYEAYSLEHDAQVAFGFGLYDRSTVTRLLRDDPTLLPKWKVNEEKDYTWNAKKVNNAISQGIIQGESIDKVAKRLCDSLCTQNYKHMKMFAQTAIGGAQNAGRYARQMEAKQMGINLVKEWMATLDAHTRDSHADIDGEQQPVGDKWHPYKFSNGCRYPKDPEGPPSEVYNCRCTLVSSVIGFPQEYERYDNIEGHPIENMTYKEWEGLKEQEKQVNEQISKWEQAKLHLQDVEEQIKKFGDVNEVFNGIWKDPVTYADYEAKKASIPAKKAYYEEQINKYHQKFYTAIDMPEDVNPEDAVKLYNHILINNLVSGGISVNDPKFIDYCNACKVQPEKVVSAYQNYKHDFKVMHDLNEYAGNLEVFETYGPKASQLLAELTNAKADVQNLRPTLPGGVFGPDAYSQQRKDAALWSTSKQEVDDVLRGKTGETWKAATQDERQAIYEYTRSFSKFNKPLRGYEYGTSQYFGVGNTDLDAGLRNNGNKLNAMTDIIEKSTYDVDVWLQRGTGYDGMDKFFDCSESLLRHGSQAELEQELLGKPITDYGFFSCGTAKSTGFNFNPIIMNVYAPSGTKMMYVEPFSDYSGSSDHLSWDGVRKQSYFGDEFETILQQGTQFRIDKIERTYNTLYIDLSVINQDHQQRWSPK